MADVARAELPKAVQDYKAQQALQRKATRSANQKNEVPLDTARRMLLDNIRLAGKACDVAGQLVKHGKPLSPEVLQACSMLSGAIGSMVVAG